MVDEERDCRRLSSCNQIAAKLLGLVFHALNRFYAITLFVIILAEIGVVAWFFSME